LSSKIEERFTAVKTAHPFPFPRAKAAEFPTYGVFYDFPNWYKLILNYIIKEKLVYGKRCLHFDFGFSPWHNLFCDRLSGTPSDWQVISSYQLLLTHISQISQKTRLSGKRARF
jgi:hypothetical protein